MRLKDNVIKIKSTEVCVKVEDELASAKINEDIKVIDPENEEEVIAKNIVVEKE